MLKLIGKEFSTETIKMMKFLKDKDLHYEFLDIDFDEEAMNFIKIHKIIGIPVLKKDNLFIVGYNDNAIKNLLSEI